MGRFVPNVWRWVGSVPRSLPIAGFGVFAVSVLAFTRVPLLPSIGESLALSATELGLLTTAFGIGRLAADLPAGALAGRVSAEPAFALACGCVAAGCGLLAAAEHGAVAYAATFVIGVGSALSNTAGMTTFSAVHQKRRGRALAAFSACLLCGQAFGPVLGGALSADGTSWRVAQGVAGGLGLLVALGLVLGGLRSAGRPAAPHQPQSQQPAEADGGRISPVQLVILYSVPFTVFFMLAAMPQTLVPIIGAGPLRLSSGAVGLALGLGGVCRLLGTLVGGQVSDRYGRKAALVPGLSTMAVGIALVAVPGQTWTWLTGVALMSVGSFGVAVAGTMLADGSQGEALGRRLGRFRFFGDIGMIVGPVVAGWLYAGQGQVVAVLAVAALPAAMAVTAGLALRVHGS